jgi:hypothetical protein
MRQARKMQKQRHDEAPKLIELAKKTKAPTWQNGNARQSLLRYKINR